MLVKDIQTGDLIQRYYIINELFLVINVEDYIPESSTRIFVKVDWFNLTTKIVSTYSFVKESNQQWLTLKAR